LVAEKKVGVGFERRKEMKITKRIKREKTRRLPPQENIIACHFLAFFSFISSPSTRHKSLEYLGRPCLYRNSDPLGF